MEVKGKAPVIGRVLSDYLFLHFKRDEWDREACFQSWGSSTEVFSWDTLCDMDIDLPPLPIQQKFRGNPPPMQAPMKFNTEKAELVTGVMAL